MQTNITQFGRVEFDASKLPQGSLRSSNDPAQLSDPFVRELDRAASRLRGDNAQDDRRASFGPGDDSADDSIPTPNAIDSSPQDQQAVPPQNDDAAPAQPVDDPTAAESNGAALHAGAANAPDAARSTNQNTSEGEGPASRTRQGKGAGPSSSNFSNGDAATQSAAGAAAAASAVSVGAASATGSAQAVTAVGAVSSVGSTAALPGQANQPATGGAVRDANPQTPGYASLDPRRLQQAEQARESMFRQIAMRLTPTGGEMRIFVDPPELGELEMRLQVDGDAMKLAVIAERPEVALTLQKHLPELRQQLAAQGIEITDAEISSREDGDAGGERHSDSQDSASTRRDTADADANPIERSMRGFVHADGFDLWI